MELSLRRLTFPAIPQPHMLLQLIQNPKRQEADSIEPCGPENKLPGMPCTTPRPAHPAKARYPLAGGASSPGQGEQLQLRGHHALRPPPSALATRHSPESFNQAPELPPEPTCQALALSHAVSHYTAHRLPKGWIPGGSSLFIPMPFFSGHVALTF